MTARLTVDACTSDTTGLSRSVKQLTVKRLFDVQTAHTLADHASKKAKWEQLVITARPPKEECGICFEAMTAAKKCVTPCGHMFHKDCMTKWQASKHECGVCKAKLHRWTPANSSSNAYNSSNSKKRRSSSSARSSSSRARTSKR
jgi:Ring finger domain